MLSFIILDSDHWWNFFKHETGLQTFETIYAYKKWQTILMLHHEFNIEIITLRNKILRMFFPPTHKYKIYNTYTKKVNLLKTGELSWSLTSHVWR